MKTPIDHRHAALYPGTFDPITYGHLDIIGRAVEIFSPLTIAVGFNLQKKPLFSLEERLEMVESVTAPWRDRIQIDRFQGLLVDYARSRGIHTVVRGLRAVTDFEYEFQTALTNRSLDPEFESIFFMTSTEYTYLSSTIVREVAYWGGNVDRFVPPFVAERLRRRFAPAEQGEAGA